jgi:hypothetical protein
MYVDMIVSPHSVLPPVFYFENVRNAIFNYLSLIDNYLGGSRFAHTKVGTVNEWCFWPRFPYCFKRFDIELLNAMFIK